MNTATLCRLLEWDSKFFGKQIATLGSARLEREQMDAALDWCRSHSIDCLYLLSQVDDSTTARLAAENGFDMVDIRMSFDADAQAQHARPQARSSWAIRGSRPDDIPALRAIAATSHTTSRFYSDGRFDPRLCGELYATWIEKSCRGWADHVLVAELEGRAAGYLTCKRREGGRAEIGLFGIAEAARGKGLGSAMVAHALCWFAESGTQRVSVVTQARNVEAQRVYQAAGFRTSSVELWHHRWFGTRAGGRR
jgi:dTDP-4-amino-4,6-dideoxy-D-galactose acyltransferase